MKVDRLKSDLSYWTAVRWSTIGVALVQILLRKPIRYHLADPSLVPFVPSEIGRLVAQMVLTGSVLYFGLLFRPAAFRRARNVTALLIGLTISVHVMLGGSYGVMSGPVFRDEAQLLEINWLRQGSLLALLVLLSIYYWKNRSKSRYIVLTSIAILVPFILQVEYFRSSRIGAFSRDRVLENPYAEIENPPSVRVTEHGLNVFVFMLDMFTGERMNELAALDSEHATIAASYPGFVWYPDTLSVGRATVTGELAVLGGLARTPAVINAQANSVSIDQLWKTAFEPLFGLLNRTALNPSVSIFNPIVYTGSCETILSQPNASSLSDVMCVDRQFFVNATAAAIGSGQIGFLSGLSVLGVFHSVPQSIQVAIYNSRLWEYAFSPDPIAWWMIEKETVEKAVLEFPIRSFNLINSEISVNYIRTNLPHDPWVLSSTCEIPNQVYLAKVIDELRSGNQPPFSHANNEICTLKIIANFNEKLMQAGLYDNSLIIVVSDHDNDSSSMLRQAVGSAVADGLGAHALLAVKYPYREGAFTLDNALMTNADVIRIIENELHQRVDEQSFRSFNDVLDGSVARLRLTVPTPAHITYQNEDSFVILQRMYQVNGSMFESVHWVRIDEFSRTNLTEIVSSPEFF